MSTQQNAPPILPRFNLSACPNRTIFTPDQVMLRMCGGLPLALIGVVVNFINLVIFAQRGMRNRKISHFLIALSFSDLLLCTGNIGFLQLPVLAEVSGWTVIQVLYPHFFRYCYPLALTCQATTVYCTVLVSIQRYTTAYHPVWNQRFSTRRNIIIVILITFLICCLEALPRWFRISLLPCRLIVSNPESANLIENRMSQAELSFGDDLLSVNDGLPEVAARTTELEPPHFVTGYKILYDRGSLQFQLIYDVMVYTLVMFTIPFVILIAVNLLVYKAINGHRQFSSSSRAMLYNANQHNRRPLAAAASISSNSGTYGDGIGGSTPGGQTLASLTTVKRRHASFVHRMARDRNISRMMLTISCVFLVCNCIPFMNNVVEIFVRYCDKQHKINLADSLLFRLCVEFGNIAVSLNSASTILVYLVFSAKYRQIFDTIFLRSGYVNGLFRSNSTDRANAVGAVAGQTQGSSGHSGHSANYRGCKKTNRKTRFLNVSTGPDAFDTTASLQYSQVLTVPGSISPGHHSPNVDTIVRLDTINDDIVVEVPSPHKTRYGSME